MKATGEVDDAAIPLELALSDSVSSTSPTTAAHDNDTYRPTISITDDPAVGTVTACMDGRFPAQLHLERGIASSRRLSGTDRDSSRSLQVEPPPLRAGVSAATFQRGAEWVVVEPAQMQQVFNPADASGSLQPAEQTRLLYHGPEDGGEGDHHDDDADSDDGDDSDHHSDEYADASDDECDHDDVHEYESVPVLNGGGAECVKIEGEPR
jgi:hypothetical protein